jgi:hypothetical protein
MGKTRVCGHCGRRFSRLDKHWTGRHACARAAAAGRLGTPTIATVVVEGDRPPDPSMPEDLGPAGRKLWAEVTAAYIIEGTHLARLEAACREADQADRADQTVMAEGEWGHDRYGNRRAHPGIAVARASRVAMSRLLTALNLETEEAS